MTLKDTAQGLINKVEQALDNKKKTSSTTSGTTSSTTTGTNVNQAENPTSTNHGAHSSNLANKADPRIDSDLDHRQTTYPAGNTSNAFGSSTGQQYSNTSNTGYNQPQSTTTGPHNSNLANKLDPRVDADGYGNTQTAGTYGNSSHATTAGTTSSYGNNPQSNNAGPHSSNVLNTIDPRVDSDRDGRNNPTSHVGGYGNTQTAGSYGNTQTAGSYGGPTHSTSGVPGNTSSYNSNQQSTASPHDSALLNKLDPRVGSDRAGSDHVGGYGNTATDNSYSNTSTYPGTTPTHGGAAALGGNHQSANAAPHNSNLLNKLDPRVDSERDGSGARGSNY